MPMPSYSESETATSPTILTTYLLSFMPMAVKPGQENVGHIFARIGEHSTRQGWAAALVDNQGVLLVEVSDHVELKIESFPLDRCQADFTGSGLAVLGFYYILGLGPQGSNQM